MKKQKYINLIFYSRTTEPNSSKLGTKHFWVKGIKLYSNGGPQKLRNSENTLKNLRLQNQWADLKQTWHKAAFGEWDSILFK